MTFKQQESSASPENNSNIVNQEISDNRFGVEELVANTFNQQETTNEEQSNIEQLESRISEINFNGYQTIPPELLAEDQDLLEFEFETLENNMDVIENYLNQINEHANTLQDKLREFLQSIRSGNLPN